VLHNCRTAGTTRLVTRRHNPEDLRLPTASQNYI